MSKNIDKPVRLQSFSSIPSPKNRILPGQILNACKQEIKENCVGFWVWTDYVATHADQNLIILGHIYYKVAFFRGRPSMPIYNILQNSLTASDELITFANSLEPDEAEQ